jgi:hypothetical protein
MSLRGNTRLSVQWLPEEKLAVLFSSWEGRC